MCWPIQEVSCAPLGNAVKDFSSRKKGKSDSDVPLFGLLRTSSAWGSWQLDPKIMTVNRDSVRRMLQVRVQTMTASCDIKLPSVPRTRHNVSVDRSSCERSSGVRADSIHGEKLTVRVEDSDEFFVDDKFATFPLRNIGNSRNSMSFHIRRPMIYANAFSRAAFVFSYPVFATSNASCFQ